MLNIFHISDLHFTNAKTGQLRDSALAAVRAILDLAEHLKSSGTLGTEVCLAVTGDLVQSGEPSAEDGSLDFDAVNDVLLTPLARVLGITPDRVFMIPGNHEMSRRAVAEADRLTHTGNQPRNICEADVDQDLKIKLAGYFDFVSRHGYSSVTASSPRIRVFKVGDQQIVCFNGLAGAYSRSGSGDKGELFVLPTELTNGMADIERNAVVLTHHPLSWYVDQCGIDLKEFLAIRRCRLLTGHIHSQGIESLVTERGQFVTIQAGASAEPGSANQVAVAWLPASNSAAVRHYELDLRAACFQHAKAADTKVMPPQARNFFLRTAAYYDPEMLVTAAKAAYESDEGDLLTVCGQPFAAYVVPDLTVYPTDQFSSRRTNIDSVIADVNHRIISGEELSGKSSLLHYICALTNFGGHKFDGKLGLLVDYRVLRSGQSLESLLVRRLTDLGLERHQAEYILQIGKVDIFIDNYDPGCNAGKNELAKFAIGFPAIRWTLATRGEQLFMPSRAPADLPVENVTYYQMAEITLPTVERMIAVNKAGGGVVERPRAIVEQVFRSINNLRAPRTVFYVKSLVDVFLNDGSVEPLNRYLLIENLLSDRIRAAHKQYLPNQPVDMEMLDTFIGQIAYRLMERSESYLNKAGFYQLVDEFVSRKGLQSKRFQADTILNILTASFVLREYEPGYGFMMLSIEDYYLARHMSRDDDFRARVMSIDGLLTFPTVAEYYVAQNPSDRLRIEQILSLIDSFVDEVSPLISQIDEHSRASIRAAMPGGAAQVQEQLIEQLGEIEKAEDATTIRFEDPKPVGRTKRVRFSEDERGAVFLQLGASILGVTRTLDQAERIEVFHRLKAVLLVAVQSIPMIAQHLAEGGEIRFRGVSIKAENIGELAVKENRYYLILRSMLYGLYKSFGTWAGSPSFYNSALQLRSSETDELVRTALFAQNIEADLSEALSSIPDITTELDSFVLKEIMIRQYVEAMTLVPLEHDDEARALDRLVNATLELRPPSNMKDARQIDVHKARLRQHYSSKVGFNSYVGRLVKSRAKTRCN